MKIFLRVAAVIIALWVSGYWWSLASAWISSPSDLGVIGGYLSFAAIVIAWGTFLYRKGVKLYKQFMQQ